MENQKQKGKKNMKKLTQFKIEFLLSFIISLL